MNQHTAGRFIAPAALLLSGLASSAPAETTACTAITSVPYTISVPGIYCLTADISTSMASGDAISVQANSVVLDLNGHKIGNLGAGPGTTASGVYAYQRQNITIRNGTIRGFRVGIDLGDADPFTTSQGHWIEGLRVDQSTRTGIIVRGRGIVIRGNQVVATATAGNALSEPWAIAAIGPANRVIDNDVITVADGTYGTGIYFLYTSDSLAVNNRITGANRGIGFFQDTGKYRDNLTSSVATPYLGGTNAGNNN